jgi:peptidoglycan hydrolase-like protein with peptidoglycan-binding domain
MNKEILSDLNKVITSLENQGFNKQANSLNNIFMKVAQVDDYRVNGANMQAATKLIQSNLNISADGLFGPSTAYAMVKALDGIAPEPTLDKAYVQRAREYVATLPAGFVAKLKNFAGMKGAIRTLENAPTTRPRDVEPSDLKIRILEALGDYKG